LIAALTFPEKPHKVGPLTITVVFRNTDYMRNSRALTKTGAAANDFELFWRD
jgi:hypothetical protein